MANTGSCLLLVLLLAALHGGATFCRAELKVGFYGDTCPGAEALVQKAVHDAYQKDPTVGPGLLRLFFHDCFVRGCDASVLLDSTPGNHAEKDADHNKSLHGFEVIDTAKADIEKECPGVVSCADILAFAARESVALTGDIFYAVPAGRRDGTISRAVEVDVNVPAADFDAADLIESFAVKNLTAADLVTLSGGHSLGTAHCTVFTERIYNFSRESDTDPTLNPGFAALLQTACPDNTTEASVYLDLVTPKVLDNQYYAGLQMGFGLLGSDQALTGEPRLRAAVDAYAGSAERWVADFTAAMVKLGNILELKGEEGQVRTNCRVVNGGRRRRQRLVARSR